MKIKILLILLLATSFSNAQTSEERDKIIANYNLDETKSLIESLNLEENNKRNRIEEYISQNPEVKEEYYINDKYYKIFDVIDNSPVYITSYNYVSSQATRTNSLYPGGSLGLDIEGEEMIIGVWEIGYPLKDHIEFLDESGVTRISTPDTSTINPEAGYHATHVTGTLAANGISTSRKGMAPKSTILAYNSNQDITETVNAHQTTGMLVSNHSYGVYINGDDGEQQVPDWYMGCYNGQARNWDQVHHNNPYYLSVVAGGNDGTANYPNGLQSGLDKLTSTANTKNNLVVASASAQVSPFSSELTSLSKSSFSSQGPTDDGRIKPDITGRGQNVSSASNESINAYGSSQGTSMSSPNVAGSLLLLQEHYNHLNLEFMRSATLRGLVCHTAMDDADELSPVTALPYPGPDPFWGWGFLNAEFAAQTITDANNNMSVLDERTLSNGETYSFTVNVSGSQKLMATICWTDLAGNTQENQLNSPNAVLVNDLDLRITDSSNNEYFPWKLDLSALPYAIKGDNLVDNIERVEVDAPTAGQYTISISHKSNLAFTVPGGGPEDQDYSIIVTGADMTLSNGSNELPNLMVWPNPAKELVNYLFANQSNQTCLVQLIDLQGRVVYSQNVLGGSANIKGSINTSGYSKGVYFLSLSQGNQKTHKKVLLH